MNILGIFFSSLLILMGLSFCNSSLHMGIGSARNPGPGFLPFIAGVLLIILSLAVVFEERRQGDKGPLWKGRKSVVALSVLLSLIAYALLLDILGFLLDTLLIFGFLFASSGKHSWKVVLGASLITTVLAFLLFGYVLKIPLPGGLLNF